MTRRSENLLIYIIDRECLGDYKTHYEHNGKLCQGRSQNTLIYLQNDRVCWGFLKPTGKYTITIVTETLTASAGV